MSSNPYAPAPALRINEEICFSDIKGKQKPRARKQLSKLLGKATPLLQKTLEPEEEIQYIAPAISPYSALEILTTGWVLTVIKRCLLVVTDRRILHLPTKSDFTPKSSVSQIRFADMEEAKIAGGLGKKLEMQYRNGKKESFTGFPGRVAKKLSAVLAGRAGQGTPTALAGRHHLCPRCQQPLTTESFTCTGCRLAFKDQKKATQYSLLIPGGGYFYTGHPVMGSVDALVELFFILAILGGVVVVAQGDATAVATIFTFGVLLGLEKLLTIYHSRHYVTEFLPAKPKAALSAAAHPATQPDGAITP
ncbi:MAG: hypothetical protein WBH75_15910 [Thermoanaerobaculia bacterium]